MKIKQLVDLSEQHQLTSDFFQWPNSREEWEQYKLSNDQIEFFHENGYLSNIKMLDEWQVDQLNEDLAEIAKPEHPDNELMPGTPVIPKGEIIQGQFFPLLFEREV